MDLTYLKQKINQQFPFVLIDRVLEIIEDTRIVCLKNVSLNEVFFANTNLAEQILPDSLIIEAIVQASSILLSKQNKFNSQQIFLDKVEQSHFKGKVYPGDQLRLEIELINKTDISTKIHAKALVDGKVICEGKFHFKLTQAASKPQIHPTASIHSSAILGKDVVVGPYAIVGENVIIGDRTVIEAHTLIEKWTQIGSDCQVHFGCVLGSPAQDIKYKGERAGVKIGDRTIIREYTTINRATGENNFTEVGSDCLLLTNVHIGHNCTIADRVIITNLTHISGHVDIEERAIIGGMVGIHQFVRIGKASMVGGYSRIVQDIPPFMLCEGQPAIVRSPNLIGLKRNGANRQTINEIKETYKILFRSNLNTQQAIEEIKSRNFESADFMHLFNFICAESKRGITKKPNDNEDRDFSL